MKYTCMGGGGGASSKIALFQIPSLLNSNRKRDKNLFKSATFSYRQYKVQPGGVGGGLGGGGESSDWAVAVVFMCQLLF